MAKKRHLYAENGPEAKINGLDEGQVFASDPLHDRSSTFIAHVGSLVSRFASHVVLPSWQWLGLNIPPQKHNSSVAS
jgi:hypothetical protein